MKTKLMLQIPDDFRILCDIFGCTPKNVLQSFSDLISLPKYLSLPGDHPCSAATNFFISYFLYSGEVKTPPGFFEKYQKKLTEIVDSNRKQKGKETAIRKVVLEWHREIQEIQDASA